MTAGRRGGVEPGRLVATMLRALAAELSDSGRFARAKAYARDGAVIDLDVRPEVVSGLVLGSRRDPYEVLLVVDPAAADELAAADPERTGSMTLLIPGREELAVSCTCPDADGTGWVAGGVCKHAIAVLLVLADESSAIPALVTRWRTPAAADDVAGDRSRHGVRRLPPRGRAVGAAAPPVRVDILARMIDGDAQLPALPYVAVRATAAAPASLDDPVARLAHELYADAVAAMRTGRASS